MLRRSSNEADSNALFFGLTIAALLLVGAIIELYLPAPHAEDVFAQQLPADVESLGGE